MKKPPKAYGFSPARTAVDNGKAQASGAGVTCAADFIKRAASGRSGTTMSMPFPHALLERAGPTLKRRRHRWLCFPKGTAPNKPITSSTSTRPHPYGKLVPAPPNPTRASIRQGVTSRTACAPQCVISQVSPLRRRDLGISLRETELETLSAVIKGPQNYDFGSVDGSRASTGNS